MNEHRGYLCDSCQKIGRRYLEEGARCDRLLRIIARFLSAASEVEDALDGMSHLIAEIITETIDQRLIVEHVVFGHTLTSRPIKEGQGAEFEIDRLKSIFASL